MTKILHFEEYIMEKLTFVGNLLHVDSQTGAIYVDPDIIGDYLSFIPQFSEIAIDENPDNPDNGWNYELTMGVSEEFDFEQMQLKMAKMKVVFSDFIEDIYLLSSDVLVVRFAKNKEVISHF